MATKYFSHFYGVRDLILIDSILFSMSDDPCIVIISAPLIATPYKQFIIKFPKVELYYSYNSCVRYEYYYNLKKYGAYTKFELSFRIYSAINSVIAVFD